MAGFSNLVQKALYLGVGLASYAGEKAGDSVVELRSQLQTLAEEMVARGEMTSEEARRMVEKFVQGTQRPQPRAETSTSPTFPRPIEIQEGEGDLINKAPQDVETLRRQVQSLQEELRQLRQPK